MIPPGSVHTGQSATSDGHTLRVLYLGPTRLDELSVDQTQRALWPNKIVRRDAKLAVALTQAHRLLPLDGAALEQGEALAAIAHILREALGRRSEEPYRRNHAAVSSARDYIHAHWRDDFSLDTLAAAAGMSVSHLSRTFHTQIGTPPSCYRRALRLQAAKQLLRDGEPLVQVAAQCGFYDQAHLNRHFIRVTGVTPARYAAASRA